MSSFLTQGTISPEKLIDIKLRAAAKWESLGFLDGLKGMDLTKRENIAKLYECEASKLLPEWAVYILECSDGTLYTGISTNVSNRVKTHNLGKGAKYTKTRLPVALKWLQWVGNRSEASKEEHRIKKLTRIQKLELINEKSNN